jgi:hypothetical protein
MSGKVNHDILLLDSALAVFEGTQVTFLRSRYGNLLARRSGLTQLIDDLSSEESSATRDQNPFITQI